jgi:signal transduction histidine kinase
MTKQKLFISVLLFFIFVGTIDFYISKQYFHTMLNENIQNKYTHIINLMKHEQLRISQEKKKHIDIILSTKGVKEAIKTKNRESLYKLLLPMYKSFVHLDKHISLLHFHLADGTSLLRMHKKQKYGDKIANLRPSIRQIHKNKKSFVVYESGLYDTNILTLRIIEPIFLDGVYLGAVEIGIDILKIFDFLVLNLEDNINLAILLNKSQRLTILKKDIKSKELDGKYLFKYSQNYKDNFSKYLKNNDTFKYKNKYFYSKVNKELFTSIDNKQLGELQIIYDVTKSVDKYNKQIIFSILKPMFVLLILFILVWYYIKQRAFLEKQIKEQENTIVAQGKFAAMGEMISMIAHQWRQPLNVIILNVKYIQMMVEQKKIKKSKLDEIIENINETVGYMNKTIEDFRNFLKQDNNSHDVAIADLVYKPKHLIEAELENSNVAFEFSTKLDTTQTIFLDSSKFFQVILNLYKNSIDEFKNKDIPNPHIKVNMDLIDDDLILTIQDNAGGIPQDIILDIFNPYFSTKGKNGTGIGLYMSKKIIQEHMNGSIEVKNIDNGAMFTITIPYSQEEQNHVLLGDDYKCFKWNKKQSTFIKVKECNQNDILKETNEITGFLDQYFITYKVLENGDIKIGFE